MCSRGKDSAGEIETKLYKGDVRTTVGGGAQVVLQDVEILRVTSPTAITSGDDRQRKRRRFSLSLFRFRFSPLTGSSVLTAAPTKKVSAAAAASDASGLKRSSDGRPKAVLSRVTDIESRCAVAIEGHPSRSKKPCS